MALGVKVLRKEYRGKGGTFLESSRSQKASGAGSLPLSDSLSFRSLAFSSAETAAEGTLAPLVLGLGGILGRSRM